MFRASLVLATVLGVTAVQAAAGPGYTQQIQHWRAQRLKSLTAPYGWLSLVGLPWLQKGANTVGSAKDNDIVLDKAPAHLGSIDWHKDGKVTIKLAAGDAHVTINGRHVREAVLLDDSHDKPTTVKFATTEFYLVSRNGMKGLRVKDSQSPTRVHFAGLDYFPVNPALRITAHWVPFKPHHHLKMGNEIGGVDTYPVPGKAVFTYQGHRYSVEPVIEVPGDTQYFLVFSDRTSGHETYGASRFLYLDPPKPGSDTVTIDFNKAYNPPCAFTPFATCPLPAPVNRLDFRVTAGEKKYAGAGE